MPIARARESPFGAHIAHGFFTLVAHQPPAARRRRRDRRRAHGHQLRPQQGAVSVAAADRLARARPLHAAAVDAVEGGVQATWSVLSSATARRSRAAPPSGSCATTSEPMELFAQQVLNGLVTGSVYSLVALGLTLIYGTMQVPNFAHGQSLHVRRLPVLRAGDAGRPPLLGGDGRGGGGAGRWPASRSSGWCSVRCGTRRRSTR